MNWWETEPASKPLAERLVRLRELIKPKAPPGEQADKERVKKNLRSLGRPFSTAVEWARKDLQGTSFSQAVQNLSKGNPFDPNYQPPEYGSGPLATVAENPLAQALTFANPVPGVGGGLGAGPRARLPKKSSRGKTAGLPPSPAVAPKAIPEALPKVEPSQVTLSKAEVPGGKPPEPPKPPVTPEESENLIKEFGRRITSKEPELFAEAQRRQISSQKSQRIAAMEDLYQKNLDSGMDVEQALFKAAGALKGEYARKPLSLGDIFAPVREQLFAKIDRTITMPIERLATGEALEKLLETGKIANVPGTKGGSQLSRLRAVFKDQPEILKALENPDEFLTKNYPPMGPRPSFLDLPVEGSQQSLGLDIPGSPRGTLNYAPTGKLGLEGGGEQLGLLQPTYEASPFAPSRAKTAMERLLEKQALEAEVVGTKPSPSPGPINIPEQGLWAPEQRPLIPQGPIPESAPLPRVSAAQRELELQALQAELGGNARQVLGPMIQYPEGSVGRQLSALPDSARERLLKVLKRVGIEAVEILNLPRVIRVSYDVSMPLRQGLVLGVRYPIKLGQSIKTMFKMGLTERTAGELERAVWRRPGTGKFILSEGYLAPISQRGKLPIGLQEEARMAQRWMRKIPGVALSERMALVFLNDFRSRVWEDAYETLMRIKAPEEEFKGAAKYINAASGRGELPKVLRGSAPIINQLLFSPRLVASRLQLPTMLFSASPVQRKMAWQGLVSMLTFGAGVLGLATLMGAKVEKDPRSSAAYKLRFGNTTVDIWGGYQQYARFAAQLATSSRKTMKGDIQEITRLSALGRFGQSKAAPLLSIILDLLQKETYVGEKLEATPQFISKYALEQITPFVLQDAYDAMRENGVIGGTALGVLSAFGAGITTIPPEKPKEAFPVRKAKGTSSSTSSAKRTTLTSDEIESLRKASRIP